MNSVDYYYIYCSDYTEYVISDQMDKDNIPNFELLKVGKILCRKILHEFFMHGKLQIRGSDIRKHDASIQGTRIL